MHWPEWVRQRVRFWKEALWRPTAAIVTGLWALTALPQFIRSVILPQFLSGKPLQAAQDRWTFAPRLPWYGWTLILVGLLLALTLEGTYGQIRKERKEWTGEKTKLNERIADLEAAQREPDFRLTAHQATFGNPNNDPSRTFVWITISVLNRGASSIAENWQAEAVISGVKRPARLMTINDGTHLTLGQQVQPLNSSDAIYQKTVNTRIETGAQVSGWLCLQVDGTTPQTLLSSGNALTVSAEDFRGKRYSVTLPLAAANLGDIRYFPGSGSPARNKKQQKGKRK